MDDAWLTGAGGALGVSAWAIWWLTRHVESLRGEIRDMRAEQQRVHDRLVDATAALSGAIGELEQAVLRIGRPGAPGDPQ